MSLHIHFNIKKSQKTEKGSKKQSSYPQRQKKLYTQKGILDKRTREYRKLKYKKIGNELLSKARSTVYRIHSFDYYSVLEELQSIFYMRILNGETSFYHITEYRLINHLRHQYTNYHDFIAILDQIQNKIPYCYQPITWKLYQFRKKRYNELIRKKHPILFEILEDIRMNYDFYICSIVNSSKKSFLITFGFLNEKNELKESSPWYVPKSQVISVDFKERIITLTGWYYSKNGHIWRYKTDKAYQAPPLLDCLIETFDPDFINYHDCSNVELKNIELISVN